MRYLKAKKIFISLPVCNFSPQQRYLYGSYSCIHQVLSACWWKTQHVNWPLVYVKTKRTDSTIKKVLSTVVGRQPWIISTLTYGLSIGCIMICHLKKRKMETSYTTWVNRNILWLNIKIILQMFKYFFPVHNTTSVTTYLIIYISFSIQFIWQCMH